MSRPRRWPPWRRVAALSALLVAGLTGLAAGALGGGGSQGYGALVYIGMTVIALGSPSLIVAQVIVGQLLVAGVVLGPVELDLIALLPLAAGMVASAELLGVAARLDMPVERPPSTDLQRTVVAAVLGAGVFAAVMWVADLPGPRGLLAVASASAACVGLAVVLAWRVRT